MTPSSIPPVIVECLFMSSSVDEERITVDLLVIEDDSSAFFCTASRGTTDYPLLISLDALRRLEPREFVGGMLEEDIAHFLPLCI